METSNCISYHFIFRSTAWKGGLPTSKVQLYSNCQRFGFNRNGPLSSVSNKSLHWTNQVESVTESFSQLANYKTAEKKQSTGNGCRLFGFELPGNSTVEEASPATVSKMMVADWPIPSLDTESDQQSEPSNVNRSDMLSVNCDAEKSCLRSPYDSQSRQIRSCTKVHMRGIAVGRAVDLTRLDRYDDLLRKLEEMFDIEGELLGPTKKWQVVYTDDEDDMMMVGDDPWHEFCRMARKIFIYMTEEVKRLSPNIKLAASDHETKPRNPDSEEAINPEDPSSASPGC